MDARTLVGDTLTRAQVVAGKVGCVVRAVEVDGQRVNVFLDAETWRIDVAVRGHLVTEIRRVG